MESPNSLYTSNTMVNNSSTNNNSNSIIGTTSTHNSTMSTSNGHSNGTKDVIDTDNIVIPSNFLISTKEIIARFPHNKRVGNYLLGRKLGEGSFAKVKEGLHTLTGQKVAIKVIDKKKAKEDAYVSKNMRREGKLLQMIIHPNIVQLYELMETENSYYLVTELCDGGDLMDYICNRKHLSESCTRKFIRQIISAVDYLHRIGILHRDLKIENLLLDKNHNIKLIDFGLSNHTKNELCITQCGSPAYAAPELLAHKKYGTKVDVWSIGVNMYAMLTGNLPFTVEPFNIKALYNKMMKNDMNSIPEHLSKNGEDLLRRLLNPDPVKRISLKEAMEHSWTNEGYVTVLKPHVYPNKPTDDHVNPTIVKYMSTHMQFSTNDVIENIKANKASSSLATYYLLLNKVKNMISRMDPKKDKIKNKVEIKPLTKQDSKQSDITSNQRTMASNAQTLVQRYINADGSTFDSNGNNTTGSVKTVTSTITTTSSAAKNGGGTKALDRVLSPIQTVINTFNGSGNQAKAQPQPQPMQTDSNQIYLTDNTINSITDKYKTIQLNTNAASPNSQTVSNGHNGSNGHNIVLDKESTFINKNTFYKTAYFPATIKTNGNTTLNSQNVSLISNGNNNGLGSTTLNNTTYDACDNGMNRSERIEKFSRSNSNNNSLIMASEINTNSIISDNKMLPSPSPINHHLHHHHHHPSNNLRCSSNNHIEMTQIIKLSPSPSIKTSDLNLNVHAHSKHPTTIIKSNTVPASNVLSPTDLVHVPYVTTTTSTAAPPSQLMQNSSNIKIISKNVSLNNPRLIKAQIPQKLSSIVLPAIDITNGRSESPGSIIKP